MPVDTHRDTRKNLRLNDFDYSRGGAYFATIITHRRECLFGDIVDGEMSYTLYGNIACMEWLKSSKIRTEIELFEDEFIVMPNHIHGIVWIRTEESFRNVRLTSTSQLITNNLSPDVRATGRSPLRDQHEPKSGPLPKSLGSFIAGYKASVTKQVNKLRDTPGSAVWMRNYHDRIIRNDRELRALREYIRDNPLRWELDRENPNLDRPIDRP
jgi:putative transposase